MADPILPGTLDLLILKAVSLGRLHGYGVLLRIEQISGGGLLIQQARSTPPSTASNIRGSSTANGAPRTTTGARSITG
jgi:hypothetical protein